jgi:hypothetical protein
MIAEETAGSQDREAGMNMEVLREKTAEELREYLQFLLWHYRVVDSFWFIFTTEEFDQETAERLNAKVWARAGAMAARELRQRFDLKRTGLEGFLEALAFYPWSLLIGYHIERKENEVLISVPSCPTQEARLKRGLGEYHCKRMHRAEFESFAAVIDPRICVECLFAPPDHHPPGMFCQWRFTLKPAAPAAEETPS